MHYIGLKHRLKLKFDKLFHIDTSDEYGYKAKNAYISDDAIIFNKKNLFLFENTSIPDGAIILNPRSKFIMKRGSFSSFNLCVCPGNHMPIVGKWKHEVTDAIKDSLDTEKRFDKDIIVEEDVWIGINVTLLNGAHIGRGCIIGAGCVVSGEWPPYAIIGGNPARVIRFLFDIDDIIKHEEALYSPEDRLSRQELEINFKKWGSA